MSDRLERANLIKKSRGMKIKNVPKEVIQEVFEEANEDSLFENNPIIEKEVTPIVEETPVEPPKKKFSYKREASTEGLTSGY